MTFLVCSTFKIYRGFVAFRIVLPWWWQLSCQGNYNLTSTMVHQLASSCNQSVPKNLHFSIRCLTWQVSKKLIKSQHWPTKKKGWSESHKDRDQVQRKSFSRKCGQSGEIDTLQGCQWRTRYSTVTAAAQHSTSTSKGDNTGRQRQLKTCQFV